MRKTLVRRGASRAGRKCGPLTGFTKPEKAMLMVLNRMSSNGASDLALVAMINEFKREETCKKRKQQKEVLIRTEHHVSFSLASFTATSARSLCF